MVMQSAEDRQRRNAADGLDGAGQGRVLGQGQVCSGAVVVLLVRAQHTTQMLLAALAANRAEAPPEADCLVPAKSGLVVNSRLAANKGAVYRTEHPKTLL
jgi:hypothetical protein